MAMNQLQRDNVTIAYQISGQGDTTLLFVHGSYIDQTYWDQQVRHFSPKYRVVTLDLPGQGQSGDNRTDWTIEGYGDDVVALTKELNLTRVILIGHSLGGDVITEAAVTYPTPVIGLIVVDFFKNAATPLPDDYQQQIQGIERGLDTNFADTNEQYARQALLTPQTPAWITRQIVNVYRNAYPPMGRPITKQLFRHYEREQEILSQLPVKLYLINVDYQPTNEEPLRQYVKAGYELIHLPGTSHYPMLESPEQLNKAIEQVVDDILN